MEIDFDDGYLRLGGFVDPSAGGIGDAQIDLSSIQLSATDFVESAEDRLIRFDLSLIHI